jgi:hypothetical protein
MFFAASICFFFYAKCSLSDRKPIAVEDEVAVMIIPDHQMLESVERITSQLSDDPVCKLFFDLIENYGK